MGKRAYHEELLHWIWKNRQLTEPLQTAGGKKLLIHHTGKLNPTDGPDFINAKFTIGNLTWHGDVEIHWQAEDWFHHGHDSDPNYNSVALHVVFDKAEQQPLNPPLPTFWMKPFLSKPLHIFFEGFKSNKSLPCSQKLSFISPGAMEAQIAKAHHLYFEQKTNDLLRFYDPELPPSEAWQKLLIIAFFDGLGIANNREPMRNLARVLLKKDLNHNSLSALKETALKKAFKSEEYSWKKKGNRPANHPEPRIKQACELLWHIKRVPFKNWFEANIESTFESCIKSVCCKPKVGKQRAGILFGTVWLPAIYLLGDLFGSANLAATAKQAWMQHRTSLPASVARPFHQAGVPASVYKQKLGTVHQLRSYCRARRCHRCEVFKSAISA